MLIFFLQKIVLPAKKSFFPLKQNFPTQVKIYRHKSITASTPTCGFSPHHSIVDLRLYRPAPPPPKTKCAKSGPFPPLSTALFSPYHFTSIFLYFWMLTCLLSIIELAILNVERRVVGERCDSFSPEIYKLAVNRASLRVIILFLKYSILCSDDISTRRDICSI